MKLVRPQLAEGDDEIDEKLPLARWAVQEIERRINAEELKPGDRLPAQRELAASMKVSRTVLREAISVLETRGLLRSQPGSGTYVAERVAPSDEARVGAGHMRNGMRGYSKLDFCRFRLAIEVSCIRLAAMKIADENIDALASNLQSFKEAIRLGRFAQAATIDAAFHLLIVEIAGVQLFSDLYREYHDMLIETIALLPAVHSRGWEALVEHERVLEALRRRDPHEAVYYMQSHITRAAERLGFVLATEIL